MTIENPSAFPHQHRASDSKIVEQYSDYGLTMRDYFAAAALTGLITKWDSFGECMFTNVARYAYEAADALLGARKEG